MKFSDATANSGSQPTEALGCSGGKLVSYRWLRWGLVAVIFISCVIFLDVGEIFAALSRVSVLWFLGILTLMTVDRLLMAWKWSVLLKALKVDVPFNRLIGIYYQGNLASVFLPTGLGGDLLRAHLVSRGCGAGLQVYASLLMEKMIGFVSAVNWAGVGLVVVVLSYSGVVPNTWIGLVISVFLLVNGTFLLSLQPLGQLYLQRILGVGSRNRLLDFIQRLFEAYSRYGKRRRALAWNGGLTVVEHGLQIFVYWAMARSLGIQANTLLFLAVTAVFLVLYRLPIAPDGWGVGEVAAIGLYGLIGISAEDAFAMAFFAHVMQMIVVLPGLWFLCRSNFVVEGRPTSLNPPFSVGRTSRQI